MSASPPDAWKTWDALDFETKRTLLDFETFMDTHSPPGIVPTFASLYGYVRGNTPSYRLTPEGLLVRKIGFALCRDRSYWPAQVRLHKLDEARKCGALTEDQYISLLHGTTLL